MNAWRDNPILKLLFADKQKKKSYERQRELNNLRLRLCEYIKDAGARNITIKCEKSSEFYLVVESPDGPAWLMKHNQYGSDPSYGNIFEKNFGGRSLLEVEALVESLEEGTANIEIC